MRKILFLFILFITSFPLVFAHKYAMVLSGGGGKGAYEVGVYLALHEYNLIKDIKAYSGTSVGGLNAALFALEPKENILTIWNKIVPVYLSGKDHQNLMDLDGIDEDSLRRIVETVKYDRIFSDKNCPKIYVNATRKRFYVLKAITKTIGLNFPHYFCLNDEKMVSEMHNLLMATSAFPLWQTKSVKLKDGYEYVDGGASDNLPIEPILNNGESYSCIFVVHLKSNVSIADLYATNYTDQNIIDIVPSQKIGGIFKGMLNFSQKKIEYLIGLGYLDACNTLKKHGFKRPQIMQHYSFQK